MTIILGKCDYTERLVARPHPDGVEIVSIDCEGDEHPVAVLDCEDISDLLGHVPGSEQRVLLDALNGTATLEQQADAADALRRCSLRAFTFARMLASAQAERDAVVDQACTLRREAAEQLGEIEATLLELVLAVEALQGRHPDLDALASKARELLAPE